MLSEYLAGELLRASVGNGAPFSAGSPTYLALLQERPVPSDDGDAIAAKEIAYNGYLRTALAEADWEEPAGLAIVNAKGIELPEWKGGSAATSFAWAICDDPAGGHFLFGGDVVAFTIDGDDPKPVIGPGLLRHAFG